MESSNEKNSDTNKLRELFKQAAKQTRQNSEEYYEAEIYEPKNYPVFVPDENRTLEEKVLDFTESGVTKWDILANKMNGDFSERFVREMDMLSGREFVRTYLKMLEYFKPKIVRIEKKDEEEKDTVIRVQVFNNYQETQEIEEHGD